LHLDETDRARIDLSVNDGDTVESEVERLLALGAKRVDWEYSADATHVVVADPDGNLFCVCA
jgi:catechol 2,3-dioxygenase-like lactoylglutathione lyase family enzyme